MRRIVKMRLEDGVLKVAAYCFLSDKKLRRIIAENSEWIKAHNCAKPPEVSQQTVPQAPKPAAEPCESRVLSEIYDGKKTVIFGEIVSVKASACAKTYLDDGVLFIAVKNYDSREMRLKSIKAYLKRTAVSYVSNEIADFGSGASLCPAKIEFRDNSDFWVKCSLASQRILCFDYRIVQLPQRLRRYVIAHGFAHFSHPLHDDDFWNFVSDVLPHYREYAKELERYRLLKDI